MRPKGRSSIFDRSLIVPAIGATLVWLPGVLLLMSQRAYGGALAMFIIGSLIAGNIDNVIRPLVYRRLSAMHPMITLVGVLAGIRYFGFLANCHRARKLALCRKLLGMAPPGPATDPPADYRDRLEALTGQSLRECPHCHTGIMVVIDCIAAPKICQPVPDT